jgi:hypothetical protein
MLLLLRQNLAEAVPATDSSSGQGFLFLTHLVQSEVSVIPEQAPIRPSGGFNPHGWDAYLDRLERNRRRRKKELEEQRIALEQAKAELEQEKAKAELPKLPNAIKLKIKAQERKIEAMLDRLESLMVLDYLEYEQEQKQARKKRTVTALLLLAA